MVKMKWHFFITFDPYYVKPMVSGHLAFPRW